MKSEPLCKKKRAVILSTDIGPDCDDVGAVALLHLYSKDYGFPIVGMINCTTNPNGTATLFALNKQVGREDIPLGQWHGASLFEMADSSCYSAYIAERFGKGAPSPEDSTQLYRRLLSEAEDDSVIIITIGMFTDLCDLLLSKADGISSLSGTELVGRKVHAVVSMACRDKAREFNVRWAPEAAKTVLELLPCNIYISDFNLGHSIITGFDPAINKTDSPYFEAYRLYPHYADCRNASWDLTTVQFAVLGEGELYGLSDRCGIRFFHSEASPEGVDDATEFIADEYGKIFVLKKNASDEAIVKSIDGMLEKILKY